MINFYQWAEEKKYDLSDIVEQPDSKKTKGEGNSTMRSASRTWAYPPQQGSGLYPKAYFRPTAADAVTYQKNNK